MILEHADQQHHRTRRGSSGGRPVSYDTQLYEGRNVVKRSYESFKQWRGLATRYDKLTVIFRGAATLRSIIMWLRSPVGDTPLVVDVFDAGIRDGVQGCAGMLLPRPDDFPALVLDGYHGGRGTRRLVLEAQRAQPSGVGLDHGPTLAGGADTS